MRSSWTGNCSMSAGTDPSSASSPSPSRRAINFLGGSSPGPTYPPASPRTGLASAPVSQDRVRLAYRLSPRVSGRNVTSTPNRPGVRPFLPSSPSPSQAAISVASAVDSSLEGGTNLSQPPQRLSSSSQSTLSQLSTQQPAPPPPHSPYLARRRRTDSVGQQSMDSTSSIPQSPRSPSGRKLLVNDQAAKQKSREAQKINDSMVYLDGPQVYTCAQCRTHLTSHDDIISKSFHGRHGRAYLFDQCVNVIIGPAEDRLLITGMHSVCDITCKRCKSMVGWTYQRAYEPSQKYKEGKFIIEKINLHLEVTDTYDVAPPAGERSDRWRKRSMSWGSESSAGQQQQPPNSPAGSNNIIYEYRPPSPLTLDGTGGR